MGGKDFLFHGGETGGKQAGVDDTKMNRMLQDWLDKGYFVGLH
jgi:hypothetical protein